MVRYQRASLSPKSVPTASVAAVASRRAMSSAQHNREVHTRSQAHRFAGAQCAAQARQGGEAALCGFMDGVGQRQRPEPGCTAACARCAGTTSRSSVTVSCAPVKGCAICTVRGRLANRVCQSCRSCGELLRTGLDQCVQRSLAILRKAGGKTISGGATPSSTVRRTWVGNWRR